MSPKCKKILAASLALFIFFSMAFAPLHVLASEPEDYAKEILQNYNFWGVVGDVSEM